MEAVSGEVNGMLGLYLYRVWNCLGNNKIMRNEENPHGNNMMSLSPHNNT